MCLLETREREEGGERENGGMRKGIGGRDGVNRGVRGSNWGGEGG